MWVRAVGLRGIVNLRGEEVMESQIDPKDAAALQARGELMLGENGEEAFAVLQDDFGNVRMEARKIAQPWRAGDQDQIPNKPERG